MYDGSNLTGRYTFSSVWIGSFKISESNQVNHEIDIKDYYLLICVNVEYSYIL